MNDSTLAITMAAVFHNLFQYGCLSTSCWAHYSHTPAHLHRLTKFQLKGLK